MIAWSGNWIMRLVSSTGFVAGICTEQFWMFQKNLWTFERLVDLVLWKACLSYAPGLVKPNQHNCSSEVLLLRVTHFTLQIKTILEREQIFPLGLVVIEMLYALLQLSLVPIISFFLEEKIKSICFLRFNFAVFWGLIDSKAWRERLKSSVHRKNEKKQKILKLDRFFFLFWGGAGWHGKLSARDKKIII